MTIKGYRVGPLLKRTAGEVMEDNVLGLGAQMAYYFFFSLFPIVLFLTPMLGLVGDRRENFNFLVTRLSGAVPEEAFALVKGVLEQVVFAENAPGIVSIGAVLALWSGSNVFNALIDALNQAYDVVKDERPWWKKRLIAIAALLGVGALFVVATIIIVAGGDIVSAVGDRLGISAAGQLVWTVAQYVLALALLVATAFIVYYFLPCVPQRKSHVLVGAVVGTTLWLLVTLGFRLYVQNFGSYNATYGTIGGVIVLLTWMYLSMVVLLIGSELASELHKGTGAVRTRAGHLFDGRISNGGPTDRPSVEHVERVVPVATEPLPTRPAAQGRRGGPSGAVLQERPPRAD
ncbi:MAG TPA: YihY/virulence factor BrkB family protein [Gemmatirosa sp.]|nr:YihY/virulence factor BrkB family protein [Gemmatirosa sp.]